MAEAANQRTLAAPRGIARIERSALGIDASLFGAAEMVMSRVIADPAGFDADRRVASVGGP